MSNRLAAETSPYLQQHRDNPVDWYPWGEDALARARAEDRPILLSIGYSSCHWCHVMAHESFEDEATAAVMNEHFVNVKVDREERPDLDAIYMSAVQQMTGHGGWPLTVFLTPEGVPFFGGTYFPPEPRPGLPSFRQVLEGVARAWRDRRAEVAESAAALHALLRQGVELQVPPGPLTPELAERAYRSLEARFDERNGGFGGAPKFPQPMVLEFLLRHGARTGEARATEMVVETLQAMAAGGIYDQLGGGFHRYSVDARWRVPHFEKMLYDNALLAPLFLHAWQLTREPRLREVVEEVLDYAVREMRSPEGGFYSAQDADSEGAEGTFYLWTPAQVDAVLGPMDGPLVRRYLDVTEAGNWSGDHHHPPPAPISVLRVAGPLEDVAAEAGVPAEQLEAAVRAGRRHLLAARERREWPSRDDKAITAWNAMMLSAFAEAARVLEREDYLEVARTSAEFLLDRLREDGRLLHTWRDGSAKIGGFLDDHALLADALVELYRSTFEVRWLREARGLAEQMVAGFWDEEAGAFHDTAADAEELLVRPRDVFDNATPSGSSAAAAVLLRLGALLGENDYTRIATRVLEGAAALMAEAPAAVGNALCSLEHVLAAPREVALIGRPDAPDTQALVRAVDERYLPTLTVAACAPDDAEAMAAVPLLAGRGEVEGRAAAYVCEQYACRAPVTTPTALLAELGTA